MVRTGAKAMAVAPFVLIIQLLFSGILFTLEGAGKIISYVTISRWSVEALGSIAKLNRLDLKLQADYPMLEHEAEAFFKATKLHVIQCLSLIHIYCGAKIEHTAPAPEPIPEPVPEPVPEPIPEPPKGPTCPNCGAEITPGPVSYTHLDVYKRQGHNRCRLWQRPVPVRPAHWCELCRYLHGQKDWCS